MLYYVVTNNVAKGTINAINGTAIDTVINIIIIHKAVKYAGCKDYS